MPGPDPGFALPPGHPFAAAESLVLITLDTLRYDAAQAAWRAGELPTLAPHLGADGWEQRHTSASFTYAAHHAFFSGFLPTPTGPGPHPRLFASAFAGSESARESTYVFSQATLPQALSESGFTSVCVGGTGFFNQHNELGRVLPSLFDEAHWRPSFGVTDPESADNQVALAVERLAAIDRPVFLFMNVSAIHQPNWFYRTDADNGANPEGTTTCREDDHASHRAALGYVDGALAPLFEAVADRGPSFWIVCSDHGTAYGENGHVGHRHAQPVVWDVPYADFELPPSPWSLDP